MIGKPPELTPLKRFHADGPAKWLFYYHDFFAISSVDMLSRSLSYELSMWLSHNCFSAILEAWRLQFIFWCLVLSLRESLGILKFIIPTLPFAPRYLNYYYSCLGQWVKQKTSWFPYIAVIYTKYSFGLNWCGNSWKLPQQGLCSRRVTTKPLHLWICMKLQYHKK